MSFDIGECPQKGGEKLMGAREVRRGGGSADSERETRDRSVSVRAPPQGRDRQAEGEVVAAHDGEGAVGRVMELLALQAA